MDGGGLDIALGSGEINPFEEHGDEISQFLALQGFLKIQLDTSNDLLSKALSEVDTLDNASKLYAPAEVLVEGLLGDEGSTRIAELQSFDEATRALEQLNETMQSVSVSVQHYLAASGFEGCEKTSLLVHRGGLDMAVPCDMSAEEAQRFMSIFGRHILMVLLFLGPGEGSLELQPFDVEADAQEIRTKPGMLVVLRADLLSHRHIPDGDDTVLSCWMLAPNNPSSRCSQSTLLQTPIVQELNRFTQEKFIEMKGRAADDEVVMSNEVESLPLSMQMQMNRSLFFGHRAAVRGIGCRVPGASAPEVFWQTLSSGTDYIVEVPPSRWEHAQYYDPEPGSYEKTDAFRIVTNIKHGSFADGCELFDHKFFGISPGEAKATSPDQRLSLECAYEAMHEAGYTKAKLTKNAEYLGVFMATAHIDWGRTERCADAQGMALGGSTISAARTSFCLGMRGPCITFDNEGASSLITTVLAVQSVVPSNERWSKAGLDCHHSLSGGSKIMTNCSNWPRINYWMCPEGRTKVFDETARGHVQGDAVVLLCVGSLTAIVDGKTVIQQEADRGAICGWRINSNGMNVSMTAPNGSQQQECIQMAFRQAGLNAWDIDAVEVHGSALPLDDAIEVTSLGMCLRGNQAVDEVLQLGSMKTNVGNEVEVAGAAALLKIAYGQSYLSNAPNLHLRTLNPNIDLEDVPLLMATEVLPYRALSSYHGVTALSQSGTNAHVTMWGNADPERVNLVAKAIMAQELCYWPGGGGKLAVEDKAVIGYFIAGSWNGWDCLEMTQESNGSFTCTLTIGENRFEEFQIWLDGDQSRALCPGAAQALQGSAVAGPVRSDEGSAWTIVGSNPGDRYQVSLKIAGKYRAVTWEKVHTASDKNEMQLSSSYYIAGDLNAWDMQEMRKEGPGAYTVDVGPLRAARNTFVIVRNKDWSQTFFSPDGRHSVQGPVEFDSGVIPFELPGCLGDMFRIQFERQIDFGVDEKKIKWEKIKH